MDWLQSLFAVPQDSSVAAVWGVWIAAILTICIYSFLYKDNPLYKFAESLFVGLGAAYFLSLLYHETIMPKLIHPLFPGDSGDPVQLIRIIPGILAVFMLLRFFPKLSWLSRWALGFIVGMYSAVNITGFAQADLVTQIYATMRTPLNSGGPLMVILNAVAVIGVFSTLIYFFFSKEHKGFLGGTAKLGIWFLMVAFGASFGYTVMGRVSLLIGRMQFMLRDWLHIIE